MAAAAIENATPTWTLANHDVDREVTRYGGGDVGLARARAMALVMLALPGAVFIYNGEELGLPNVELPDEALRDPVWERSGHTRRGRDALPGADAVGGRRSAVRVLRQSRHLAADAAGVGDADGGEAARATRIRRCRSSGGRSNCGTTGQNSAAQRSSGSTLPIDALVFRRRRRIGVRAERGAAPMALPEGEVLLASGALVDGKLPPNTAAWLV